MSTLVAEGKKRLSAANPSDPNSFKTRKGKIGSYSEHLTEADQRFVEERIAALLPDALEYRLPGRAPEPHSKP